MVAERALEISRSKIVIPENLARDALDLAYCEQGERFSYHALNFGDEDCRRFNLVIDFLGSRDLADLVRMGRVTLVMIRPQAHDNKVGGMTDGQAVGEIFNIIERSGLGLKPLFEPISVILDREFVEEFYRGAPKESQLKVSALRYPIDHPNPMWRKFANRWEEWLDLSAAGASTFVLLYSPRGTAIEDWRSLVSHWDSAVRRRNGDNSSIRAVLAKDDNYNNHVHGSSDEQSVNTEIGLVRKFLIKIRASL